MLPVRGITTAVATCSSPGADGSSICTRAHYARTHPRGGFLLRRCCPPCGECPSKSPPPYPLEIIPPQMQPAPRATGVVRHFFRAAAEELRPIRVPQPCPPEGITRQICPLQSCRLIQPADLFRSLFEAVKKKPAASTLLALKRKSGRRSGQLQSWQAHAKKMQIFDYPPRRNGHPIRIPRFVLPKAPHGSFLPASIVVPNPSSWL